MLDHLKNSAPSKREIAQLKNQLEESEFTCAAAVKARKAMEVEIEDLHLQIDDISKAKTGVRAPAWREMGGWGWTQTSTPFILQIRELRPGWGGMDSSTQVVNLRDGVQPSVPSPRIWPHLSPACCLLLGSEDHPSIIDFRDLRGPAVSPLYLIDPGHACSKHQSGFESRPSDVRAGGSAFK
ncbi:uncharacterized protein LOC123254957 isoform X1 [Gracilinanus agilis]|uniref:uncharacterized protein LOC123254957 isoform X1 n=1 Tax=Gracilinanus agilis TaxID=191870 RepID=UPI001CFE5B98|nr:uncharacterized protein LOC123254957 isoform X1 [Gracilinanus agilis]